MAHELLIVREEPILIDEWLGVVSKLHRLRRSENDARATNPISRAEIRIPKSDGDVDVLLENGKSVKVFRFSKGKILFKLGDEPSFILNIARQVATMLEAQIINEDGSALNS